MQVLKMQSHSAGCCCCSAVRPEVHCSAEHFLTVPQSTGKPFSERQAHRMGGHLVYGTAGPVAATAADNVDTLRPDFMLLQVSVQGC
jgi:hypothetical protein